MIPPIGAAGAWGLRLPLAGWLLGLAVELCQVIVFIFFFAHPPDPMTCPKEKTNSSIFAKTTPFLSTMTCLPPVLNKYRSHLLFGQSTTRLPTPFHFLVLVQVGREEKIFILTMAWLIALGLRGPHSSPICREYMGWPLEATPCSLDKKYPGQQPPPP